MGSGNVWKGLLATGHPPVLHCVEEGEEESDVSPVPFQLLHMFE